MSSGLIGMTGYRDVRVRERACHHMEEEAEGKQAVKLATAAIVFGLVLVVKGAWSYVVPFDQGAAPGVATYMSVAIPAPVGIAVGVALIVVGYIWRRRALKVPN